MNWKCAIKHRWYERYPGTWVAGWVFGWTSYNKVCLRCGKKSYGADKALAKFRKKRAREMDIQKLATKLWQAEDKWTPN